MRGAWRHAAADNPDVILFLGDYIYENGPRENLPRRHNKELATDLASYRKRYGLYKADADLQAAHAAAPWMVVWDDHEVVNNYKAERSPGMEDRAAFLKAWFDALPNWALAARQLAAAKGHAHLAILKLGGQTDQGPGKSLTIINRQIDRMTKLVEELLDISRLQAGRLSLELERFNLAELVRETCDRMSVLSQAHPLRVEAPESLEGLWDRGRLDQVLTNYGTVQMTSRDVNTSITTAAGGCVVNHGLMHVLAQGAGGAQRARHR